MKQDSLGEMFANPYWSRLWILQETLLARRLKLDSGFDFIDWSSFQLLCDPEHKDALVNAPEHIRWLAKRTTSAKQILVCDAIMHCTDNECADPRDKIYGIQSLLGRRNRLKVNYAKSVGDVFLEAAVMVVRSSVCVIGDEHEMVCPDAPAECECSPAGELEQIMLSIEQLANAMGLTGEILVKSNMELSEAVRQYRLQPDSERKAAMIEGLRSVFRLPMYKTD